MSLANETRAPLRNADRFFIGGEWVKPSSDAMIDVIEPGTEELFFSIAAAEQADMLRAVAAARQAFDEGPWPRMSHAQRAEYLRAIAAGLRERTEDIGQIWPRECGVLHKIARRTGAGAAATFEFYAGLAETYPFEEPATPTAGEFGLIVREPVGVVGAIIPWNAPMGLISNKIAPALLAGCTVILKSSPEAPGEGYLVAEVAEAAGLPPGVLNVVTADRGVSELPKDLDRGWFVEPTVFGNVDNSTAIAQEEIFGPVLSVIPAENEEHAITVANDTIYGLNASVFTNDVDRAREVARQLRSGTVGHNAFRTDFGMAFGGFKQSGIGREGGREGLLPFLETKTVILEGRPAGYEATAG